MSLERLRPFELTSPADRVEESHQNRRSTAYGDPAESPPPEHPPRCDRCHTLIRREVQIVEGGGEWIPAVSMRGVCWRWCQAGAGGVDVTPIPVDR